MDLKQQNFKSILKILKEIDLLYHQKKNDAAEQKIETLLEKNTGEDAQKYILQIIQNIQIDKKIISEETSYILTYDSHPNAEKYDGFYNHDLYAQLMPYCALAYLTENNGNIEEHALKLSVAFSSANLSNKAKDSALKYIYNNCENNNHIIHDACLFVLPDVLECDFIKWKNRIKSHLNDEGFRNLLPNANVIEELIKEKITIYEDLKKRNKRHSKDIKSKINALQFNINSFHDAHGPLSEDKMLEHQQLEQQLLLLENTLSLSQAWFQDIKKEVTIIENAISSVKKKLNLLKAEHGDLDEEQKQIYQNLNQTLSDLYLQLYEKSVIDKFDTCSIHQLKSLYEYYIVNNEAEYSYMLRHGLTQNDYEKFKRLECQNDDQSIPNLSIGSEELDQPSVYIKKVNIENDWEVARACCLGKLTNCCQSLSGEDGEPCVIYGLTSPNSGFYVLCRGDVDNPQQKDEVLGQCWAWRSKNDAIVFDSIETSRNADKTTVEFMFNKLAKKIIDDKYTHKVACGFSNEISLGISLSSFTDGCEEFIDYNDYCDSEVQNILFDINKPYYHYYLDSARREQTDAILNSVIKSDSPLLASEIFWDILAWDKVESSQKHRKIFCSPPESEMIATIREIVASCSREEEFLEFHKIFNKYYYMLAWAARKGDLSTVQTLLDNGTDPTLALECAAMEGHIDIMQLLLDKGANPDWKTINGAPVLALAARSGHTAIVQALLDKGAEPMPVLVWAAKEGHTAIVQILLENGVNLNSKINGFPALVWAVETGHISIAKFLLKKVTDPKILIWATKEGYTAIVQVLLKNGANPNTTIKDLPLLALAARNGRIAIVQAFLNNGADYNAVLAWAARQRYTKILQTLLNNGADYRPVLMWAAKNGDAEIAIELQKAGAKLSREVFNAASPEFVEKIKIHQQIAKQESVLSKSALASPIFDGIGKKDASVEVKAPTTKAEVEGTAEEEAAKISVTKNRKL